MYSSLLLAALSPTLAPGFGSHGRSACWYDSCGPMRYGWIAPVGCYVWPLAYGVYPPILPYGGYGLAPAPAATTATSPVLEMLPIPREEPKRPLAPAAMPATIVLAVPAEATVYFDGNRMTSTSTLREYKTPALEPGKDYFYEARIVVDQGGKQMEETKRIVVRAGEKVEVSFAHMATVASLMPPAKEQSR
jgi:uncharacterized protein (TIGR03000 family)